MKPLTPIHFLKLGQECYRKLSNSSCHCLLNSNAGPLKMHQNENLKNFTTLGFKKSVCGGFNKIQTLCAER